ncbi:MAG TPA: hypothetical protein VMJ32_05295 [Pirellulales bacterium]|nr:hypothetical protein [Pirellulales bacterium]
MKRPQSRRSFERLETRQMMAGNVVASVVGGNLTITGDDAANVVTLQEIGDTGQWQITLGQRTWTDNHVQKFVTDTVTGNITVNLNGGADNLTIKGGSIPGHLTILMGDGDDSATLTNLQIGTFLHFEGGAGNDQLTVKNVHVSDPTFAYFSSIDMQDGNDRANIRNFTDQDLQLTMGAGNDHLTMTDCTFVGGPFQRLQIDTGDGNDTTTLKNDATGPLTVNTGTGKNDLKVTDCTADSANFENSGTGKLSGSGNTFGADTVAPGFTHLLGEFNV